MLKIKQLGAWALAAVIGLHLQSTHAAVLLHSYDFSSGVTDLVGTANGTLLGGAVVSGGALRLDGVDDYVQFSAHIVPTSGSYSVAMFGKRNVNQGAFTEMVSQGSTAGPGFYLGTNPAGIVRAGDVWGATGVAFGAVGSTVHYAVVVDAVANSTKLFEDGALVATLAQAITSGAGGTDTRLGRQFDPFSEYFNGVIDEFRIYTGALTATEVAALAGVAVPEPGSLALCVLGLAVAARSRRRAAA